MKETEAEIKEHLPRETGLKNAVRTHVEDPAVAAIDSGLNTNGDTDQWQKKKNYYQQLWHLWSNTQYSKYSATINISPDWPTVNIFKLWNLVLASPCDKSTMFTYVWRRKLLSNMAVTQYGYGVSSTVVCVLLKEKSQNL